MPGRTTKSRQQRRTAGRVSNLPTCPGGPMRRRRRRGRRTAYGFTLLELSIVSVIIGILAVMAVPLYQKAIEQARVDDAGAKLQAIWSAQRIYWLDRRQFAESLADLEALDLLDASYAATQGDPDANYVLDIRHADDATFSARARRADSNVWSGELEIDQTGEISGQIQNTSGDVLFPMQ